MYDDAQFYTYSYVDDMHANTHNRSWVTAIKSRAKVAYYFTFYININKRCILF
jgi:hypothetical protein